MTARRIEGGRTLSQAVRLGLVAGLLAVLAACAPRHQSSCVDSGGLGGAPSLIPCVEKYFEYDRDDRGR